MRLTKHHRQELERQLLQGRFDKRYQRLEALRIRLGISIYKAAFNRAERELLNRLPRGWVPRVDEVQASMNGTVQSFPVGDEVPIPANKQGRWNSNVPLIVVDSKEHRRLYERYEAIQEEERLLNKEANEARSEIRAVLAGLNTAKQLKQHWPEIAHIVDAVVPEKDKVSRAIAVRTERVNELLGFKTAPRPEAFEVVG